MWAAQFAFAVMSPLVHTRAKSSNVWFSPISRSLTHISVVVMCCCCFHTMPRAGWMLSKCGFTWAIKWAVLFLCCSDTSVGAAFKGIAFFVALFIEMLLSSCPSLLNSCPLFLVILSYRVFHSGLQGSFLYSIFLYFLGIKSFHLPWWLFTSCFYLHLLSCCLLLQQKPQKTPCLPGSLQPFTVQ